MKNKQKGEITVERIKQNYKEQETRQYVKREQNMQSQTKVKAQKSCQHTKIF